MASSWALRFTRWRPHYLNGLRYDLTHLHPFRFNLQIPATCIHAARNVDIQVAFSSHCFTQKCLDGTHDAAYSTSAHDRRKFCLERHTLSNLLPDIVRDLDRRICYFNFKNSQQRNYITVDIAGETGALSEYLVFFDVRSAGDDNAVLTFVQSAFPSGSAPKPHGIGRKKVGFRVLVNLALKGQKPQPPA
jgi:hypothetical protein